MESFTIKSLTVLAVLCQYITLVSPCVLLLNGWTPVSVKERTNLAEIVISGKVRKAFKDSRTSSQTYTAQVEILEVYKGRSLLSDLTPGRGFNISNFGDKPACYAEVFQGTDYIFFLTLFEGRLSAKYDDIFGATADFIPENVDEVLEAQGWDSWSPWSACSESCEGGQKNRQRSCRRETEGCEGEDIQTLACNLFTCRGAADLLKAFGAEKLPRGVERVGSRDGVYRIGQAARLSAPTRSVFPSAFPADFSILITANLAADFSGYVFTVTDSQQKVRLGVHYADGAWRFEYSDQDGLPGVASPMFEDLYPTDGQWHQLAFRVQGQDITMFWDCEDGVRRSLLRTRWPRIPVNSVLALGSYLTQNGSPFKGQLEQLVISEDPRVAALQCGRSAGSGKDSEQNDSDEMTTVASTSRGFQWTDWSPCSVTCGVGLQTRSLFCRDNQVEAAGCVPRHIPRYQARRCRKQQCPGNCRQPCLNGGSCDVFGRCLCGVGYTGEQCEKAVCDPPCRNGGYCISPGQCACPYGYLEPDCSPFCQSECLNGGSCVGPDVCLCPPGFAGDKCEKAVCEDGCMNGGKCVGPNKCTCRHGYTGPRCENAECYPACQNGGVCEKPYQCSCKSGTIGWFCEHFMCTKRCQNGGVCVGPNKCSCPAAFRGARCHKRACRGGCLNGGRCVRKRKCQCPLGFRGKRCQKRTCRVEGRLEPFTKKYLRAVTEHVSTPCGPRRLQICLQTRIKHVTVSRVVFRAVFRCV